MVRRGGFSFIAMVVINPIVILFYQNCSISPVSHATVEPPAIREVSSIKEQKTAEAPACRHNNDTCPRSSID